MELTHTIDSTFEDLAKTLAEGTSTVADHTPAPLDALILRIGAVNSEAVRQYGRVTATTLDAVTGVANAAWHGATDLLASTEDAVEASTDTLRRTGRRAVGDAKQAKSTIANRASSAADDVGRNFSVVADEADRVEDRIERESGAAADRVVKATDTGAAQTASVGAERPIGPYENWTKEELYERAQEFDIEGRSGMSKTQLIKALRSA